MKYIFIPYLFNAINIHILRYKLSQTSNSLVEKKSKWTCGTEGVPFHFVSGVVFHACRAFVLYQNSEDLGF
jgi:hypothetical protein